MSFYLRTIRALPIKPDDKVLVVCGGTYDASVLREAGLTDVTISNLMSEGHASRGTDYGDYKFANEDAEKLSFPAQSFDWVIAHAGLHHCASPHVGVLEMLRVARKGILAIEARDSMLMHIAVALGFVPEFEFDAVALNGFKSGGVRDSSTPNFILRWTEREVRKMVESAYPGQVNEIRYFYHLSPPLQRLTMASGLRRLSAHLLIPALKIFHWVFPRQCNEFGFAILQTGKLKPWMGREGMRPDYKLDFDPKKYRPNTQ